MNIVLVHGAWADGSSWSAVIERLQADGYHVTAPQFPMTQLSADVAGCARCWLARTARPSSRRCAVKKAPPALIVTAEADVLRDEGRRMPSSCVRRGARHGCPLPGHHPRLRDVERPGAQRGDAGSDCPCNCLAA